MTYFKKTVKVLKNGKIIINKEIKDKIISSVEFPNTLLSISNKVFENEFSKIKHEIERMLEINLLNYNKSVKQCLITKPLFDSNNNFDILFQKYNFYKNIKSFIRSKKNEINISREKIINKLIQKANNEDFNGTLLVRCFLYLEELYKKNCEEINSTYKLYSNEALHYKQQLENLKFVENIKSY